ncbi:MAG: hypothetical protein M1835_004603 [Candelina submexicana]|nr:MAG: hypothetical protein M1835_004603 [Candelina submexicana]
MLSIRTITRYASRAISRLPSPSICRPLSTIRQPSILQSSWNAASRPTLTAAFSSSRIQQEKEGEVDDELVAKFESELQMEKEMRDTEEAPVSVKDFLENSQFELQDTPGQEEVLLTRQFGDESIRITFTIADLEPLDSESDRTLDDQALRDEDVGDIPEEGQSGGANTKGSVNQGRTKGGNIKVAPEDSIAPADRPEFETDESLAEDGEQESSFPARLNVTVHKAGQGALQIEAVAQDGLIVIDNVYYFPDPELADAKSAEKDWQKRGMYTGPPFGNLDEDLQVLLEKYLDERGVNTALALFVPDYIDFKEQREYLRWLSNVKSFVEA